TGLTKSGTSALTLSTVNTYTGNTSVNGGTLTIAASGSIASNVTIATGAVLNVNGSLSPTANVTVGGNANFAGNTSTVASLTRNLGTLAISSGGTAKVLASASTLTPEILHPSSITFADNTSKLDLTNNEMIT